MKKNRFFLLLVVIYMTSFYSCNVDEDLNDTIVEADLELMSSLVIGEWGLKRELIECSSGNVQYNIYNECSQRNRFNFTKSGDYNWKLNRNLPSSGGCEASYNYSGSYELTEEENNFSFWMINDDSFTHYLFFLKNENTLYLGHPASCGTCADGSVIERRYKEYVRVVDEN